MAIADDAGDFWGFQNSKERGGIFFFTPLLLTVFKQSLLVLQFLLLQRLFGQHF